MVVNENPSEEKNVGLRRWEEMNSKLQISLKTLVQDKWADLESGKSIVSVNGTAIPFSQIEETMVNESDKPHVSINAAGG